MAYSFAKSVGNSADGVANPSSDTANKSALYHLR